MLDKCIQQTYNTNMTSMIRTQIYIPGDLHQSAKAIARKEGEPLAELLRRLIRIGVTEAQKKLKPKSLTSLAKLQITEGPNDLSRNMDKYLYQK